MDLDENSNNLHEDFFQDYKPKENNRFLPPKHVIYLLLAVSVTVVTLFAMIRHLIIDLIHDLADYLFGEQPVEEQEFPWERREKFRADWTPEVMPELEDMDTDKDILQLMEGTEDLPAIWVISDKPQPSAKSSIQTDVSDS
nr:small integral membrane protein 24 isoform X1 [Danio rerio]XP_021333953.1 small integral membrane protein 24 isoform X1 [Danio rerio]|eukprot:XP_017212838.1 small integral membrane protein 24 isoform X1 [Danio rerio]